MKTTAKYKYQLSLLSILLLLSGCSAVNTSARKGTDFHAYKTYAWLDPDINTGDNPLYKSDLIHNNIKGTVDRELKSRGFRIDNKKPDLFLKYHTYTEKKETVNGGFSPYYYSPFYYPGRFGWGYGGAGWISPFYGSGWNYPMEYTEGTLVLDFVDSQSKELIWRGSIEGDVEDTRNLSEKVAKAAEAIMAKYPVKQLPVETKPEPKNNENMSRAK